MSPTQIFVCDWIPPQFGAVGQYTLKRARDAAERGEQVVLIGLGSTTSEERERIGAGELQIVRLAMPPVAKSNMLRRALWTLEANAKLLRAAGKARKQARDAAILVTGSPPLLAYLILFQNSLFWRNRVNYRITDFYPETALAAGKASWLALAKPVLNRLRRTAHRIEVLGEDQARRLSHDPALAQRIVLRRDDSPIDNWNDASSDVRPFGEQYCLVLYSGNMGLAHEVETFCEAYKQHVLAGPNRVRLWINGTGVRVAEVQQFCQTNALPLIVTPPVPLDQLAGVLKTADAHLILLRREFWGFVLPSKIYACLEAGQPILYVGPAESDVHLLSSRLAERYWRVEPGNVEQCVRALNELSALDRSVAQQPRSIDFELLVANPT